MKKNPRTLVFEHPHAAEPLANKLSTDEMFLLRQNEEIISRGLHTFVDVGCALSTIKEKHLYRSDYQSFAEYCRQKWDISRIHAYRLVNAAEVCRLLSLGNSPLPDSEAQVRPLTCLPRENVASVWIQAVRRAGKARVTAKVVEEVVANFSKGAATKAQEQNAPELWQTLAVGATKELKKAILEANTEEVLQKIEKIRVLIEQLALSGINDKSFQEEVA